MPTAAPLGAGRDMLQSRRLRCWPVLAAWVAVPPLDNGSVAINPLPMPLPTAATARRTAALNPARDFELPAPVPHALSSPALASHDAPLDGHLPQHLTLTLTLSLALTLTSIT